LTLTSSDVKQAVAATIMRIAENGMCACRGISGLVARRVRERRTSGV
jgi:hypothetical protein